MCLYFDAAIDVPHGPPHLPQPRPSSAPTARLQAQKRGKQVHLWCDNYYINDCNMQLLVHRKLQLMRPLLQLVALPSLNHLLVWLHSLKAVSACMKHPTQKSQGCCDNHAYVTL